MDIYGGFWGGASNDSGDVDKAIFSVFVGIALETLDISQGLGLGLGLTIP